MPRLKLEHRYTAGLLLLTASTGAIDAVSYLALDRVFTGNMTGNVLFLGFALVGVPGIPFLNNAIALGGFVIGAIVASRILGRHQPKGFPVQSMWVLIVGGALLFATMLFWLWSGDLPEPALLIVTAVLACVMGAHATAVRPIGNSDVTTIVVTSTLVNLAIDSRLAGGHAQRWIPRVLAIAAVTVGAALGAALIALANGLVALVAAGLIFAFGTLTLIITSRMR